MSFFDLGVLNFSSSITSTANEEKSITNGTKKLEYEEIESEEDRIAREEKEEQDLIDRLINEALNKVDENEQKRKKPLVRAKKKFESFITSEMEIKNQEELAKENIIANEKDSKVDTKVELSKAEHFSFMNVFSNTTTEISKKERIDEGLNAPEDNQRMEENTSISPEALIEQSNQQNSEDKYKNGKPLSLPSSYRHSYKSQISSASEASIYLDVDMDSTFKNFYWDIIKQSVYFLQNGFFCLKKMNNEMQYHERFIYLSTNIEVFCWGKTESAKFTGISKSVPIQDINLIKKKPQHYDEKKFKDNSKHLFLQLELRVPIKSNTGIDLLFPSESELNTFCHHFYQVRAYLDQIYAYENHVNDQKIVAHNIDTPKESIHIKSEKTSNVSSLLFGSKTLPHQGQSKLPFIKIAEEENLSFLKDTTNYSLYKYIDTYITKGKNTLAFLEHRSKSISSPLTKVDSSRTSRAIKIFQYILNYTNSTKTSTEDDEKIDLIESIKREIAGFQDLIFEVYIQLIKQCMLYERYMLGKQFIEIKKLWELLLALTGEFLPDDEHFISCLVLFCDRHRFMPNAIGAYANHIYYRLRNGATSSLSKFADISSNYIPQSVFNVKLEDVLRKEYFIENCNSDGSMLISNAPFSFSAEGDVPVLLELLVERIRQVNGLKQEGIFRLSSDTDKLQNFKNLISDGRYVTNVRFISEPDPILLANMIKLWIRELSEPLIPFILYEDLLQQVEKYRLREYLNLYSWLLKELPSSNLQTIFFLAKFFAEVSEQSAINKMTKDNLLKIFAPIFMWPDEKVAQLMGRQPEDEILCLPLKQKFLEFIWLIVENCL